jgi:hypothetical protein
MRVSPNLEHLLISLVLPFRLETPIGVHNFHLRFELRVHLVLNGLLMFIVQAELCLVESLVEEIYITESIEVQLNFD